MLLVTYVNPYNMLADKIFHYSYSQIDNHKPAEFCLQALSNSNKLDLGLGYFSSASFNVLANGMARFIVNGGTMNLYINKYISEEDYNLLKGNHDDNFDKEFSLHFQYLKETFSSRDEHFFRCIAFLIKEHRINIKIIVLCNGGLPHEKYGIFTDNDGNKIYFNGSMNMTANAILGNLETIECTCSWKGKDSLEKVQSFEDHFTKVWNGKCEGIKIYDAKHFCSIIQDTYPNQDPEQLLSKEKEFIKHLNIENNKKDNNPSFPKHYKEGALPYQKEAYKAWVDKNKLGIFAMATGTGKTVTSLNCVLNEYQNDKYYQILILVPTLDLVDQWSNELANFNFRNEIVVSSLNPLWRKQLLNLSDRIRRGKKPNFVIISTYDSFVSKDFQTILPYISNNLILIADEAHNIGGTSVTQCFKKIQIKRRIALSATPERVYDDDNSQGIGVFFNDKFPYTYSFPMSKAIETGRLCRYYYYPRVAYLNEEEMELYSLYTKKLVNLWDDKNNCFTNKKEAEIIMMNRKRIIHKCNDKIKVYSEILKEIGENKLKYTFVYAPQGKYTNTNSEDVQLSEEDDISFINKLLAETKKSFPNKNCNTFTGKDSKSKRSILLKSFEDGTLDVLLAMKCLDEGVDIPRAEVGIFTSSTGNPREFIQRRGRLLRRHQEKKYSYIYDIIVIPDTISRAQSFKTMESNIVRSELKRVAYFSQLAQNCYANDGAYQVLNEIANHFGIIWNELTEKINQ